MPSEITVKLERAYEKGDYIFFKIREKEDALEIDSICIERKVPRKHRDKACWSIYTHYTGMSIGYWLERLSGIGFDTSEFEQACIELGWEKEVIEYRESKKHLDI